MLLPAAALPLAGVGVAHAAPGAGASSAARQAPVASTVPAGPSVSAASSGTATYTATETIPVPPASSYAGSGGGDGWALALTPTAVYNVFHHSSILQVACHLQADASPCWNPETITDAQGDNFATSGQPGLWLDQATGKLYVFATRVSDLTAGVVCIDTTQAASNPDPFCGFTALTAPGAAPLGPDGISAVSNPALADGRWYAFNYVFNQGISGAENALLCFNLTTLAACSSQPYPVVTGSGTISDSDFPPPAVAAIGTHVIVPVTIGGTDELACFDAGAGGPCSGSWPVTLGFSYDSSYGAAFPVLASSGAVTGLCLPATNDPCYSLAGAAISTPAGMTSAIAPTSGWNGPAFTLGPRVYLPDGNLDQVDCYDYSASAGCAGFPKALSNLGLLYTVNPDPQRPSCIWVNSDDGTEQIQNFDAYTGSGCGQGPIRVLASSLIAPTPLCTPLTYSSLQVTSPAPGTYSSGTVAFEDGDGNPLPGISDKPLDATGTASLAGLNLGSGTGLPQFLITLNGEQTASAAVTVQLTWTGTYDPSCVQQGTTVKNGPTTLTTSLSGGGHSGPVITVPVGTAVTDSATLSGPNAKSATGTVTYRVYSDNKCTTLVNAGTAERITTAGTLPPAAAVTLNAPGTYYWTASYSGDSGNQASASACGSETATATVTTVPPTTLTTSLSGGGKTGTAITVPAGSLVTDSATLSGTNAAAATGTVTYNVYSDSACTKLVKGLAAEKITIAGTLPKSAAVTLAAASTYYWTASYSGDAANQASASKCGSEKLTVMPLPATDTMTTAVGKSAATATVTTTVAGDLLVALVAGRGPSGTQTAAVSGGGVTWHFAGRENAGRGDVEVWTATAGSILKAVPVKATAKTSGFTVTMTIVAVKHAVAAGALAKAEAASGAPKVTLKTARNDAWVLAMADDSAHPVTPKPAAGQFVASRVADSTDTFWAQATSQLMATAGTSVNISDSTPTADPWDLIAVEVY